MFVYICTNPPISVDLKEVISKEWARPSPLFVPILHGPVEINYTMKVAWKRLRYLSCGRGDQTQSTRKSSSQLDE